MSQPLPLPSLFGRFTAILQDHDNLAKTLRSLRALCAALEDGTDLLPAELSPKRLLEELRADLTGHFGAEESPEYFGAVMDEAPELVPAIGGLKWEHMTMLHAVEVLCGIALDRARWRDLAAPTRELIGQLERHERAESALLRRLFTPRSSGFT
jgi:hypothetical protein